MLSELTELKDVVFLDARSPKEFEHAQIPGAHNLCLLNNEERHIVGLTYKEQGHEVAVRKGFELVGHKFSGFIDEAHSLAPAKKILLYCWRGGLRSNIMAWLLNLAGFEVTLLKGGYKHFRNLVLEEFLRPKNILVLSGKTGTGKTKLLHELKNRGEAVLDLEDIAHHKGSAFGSLGQLPQPTVEMFENITALQLVRMADRKIWIEDESRWIGRAKIPDALFNQICSAKSIAVERNYETRKQIIIEEYGIFSTEELAEKTTQLKTKLGGDRLKLALSFLEDNNLSSWVDIMFWYYDKNYGSNNEKRGIEKIRTIDFDLEDDYQAMSKTLVEMSKQI